MSHILPGLRFARLWVVLGVVLLLIIVAGCLLPGQDIPDIVGSDKLKHAVAFGLLAFWFGSIVLRADLRWVAAAAVALGALIEVLQGVMGLGRDPEWLDLAADALGVLLGVLLVLTPLGQWPRWFEALAARAGR